MSAINPYAPPGAAVADIASADALRHQPVKLFSPRGRIGRLRYLAYLTYSYLLLMLATFVLSLVLAFGTAATGNGGPWVTIAITAIALVVYFPFYALITIQRSHDMNWSGWTALLTLVPLLVLVWVFKGGTPGENRFGATPPPNTLAVKVGALADGGADDPRRDRRGGTAGLPAIHLQGATALVAPACRADVSASLQAWRLREPVAASANAMPLSAARRLQQGSVLQVGRHLAAVFFQLVHHLLVQPDVHGRGIALVAGVVQLVGQVLARLQAAVDVQQLHQVDDGGAPVELLAVLRRHAIEHLLDVDAVHGGGCLLRRARCAWLLRRGGGDRGGSRRAGRLGSGAAAMEDLAENIAEDAHVFSLRTGAELPPRW